MSKEPNIRDAALMRFLSQEGFTPRQVATLYDCDILLVEDIVAGRVLGPSFGRVEVFWGT